MTFRLGLPGIRKLFNAALFYLVRESALIEEKSEHAQLPLLLENFDILEVAEVLHLAIIGGDNQNYFTIKVWGEVHLSCGSCGARQTIVDPTEEFRFSCLFVNSRKPIYEFIPASLGFQPSEGCLRLCLRQHLDGSRIPYFAFDHIAILISIAGRWGFYPIRTNHNVRLLLAEY